MFVPSLYCLLRTQHGLFCDWISASAVRSGPLTARVVSEIIDALVLDVDQGAEETLWIKKERVVYRVLHCRLCGQVHNDT